MGLIGDCSIRIATPRCGHQLLRATSLDQEYAHEDTRDCAGGPADPRHHRRPPPRRSANRSGGRTPIRPGKGPAGDAAHDAGDRQGLIEKRPFASITDLNAICSQKLTQPKATEFYGKAFVHINLKQSTAEEILLVPNAGKRMAHRVRRVPAVADLRAVRQGDSVSTSARHRTAQLAQYTFIPVRLNSATDDDILSIPGTGQRMVREFKEYRPWKSKEQFVKEIGKYVGTKEAERMWRYVVID